MERREILKYTAYLTGAVVALPIASSLVGCKSDILKDVTSFKPAFFSEQDYNLVKIISDIIIPKTDSPSASEVGVPAIIDQMVDKVYQKEDKEKYKAGFSKLINYLNLNTPFESLNQTEQVKAIQAVEELDGKGELKDVKKAYQNLKQQMVAYYLSNEAIAEKYLNYVEVPGNYVGCVSLEETGGSAWGIQ